jgi:hypothetical protein
MNRATEEEQNLAMEKVTGDSSWLIRKRVRRTSGVDRVRRGWTREWRIVGR